MHRISLVSDEQAQGTAKELFQVLRKKGPVSNMFRAMAHQPGILQAFLPLYSAVTGRGAVERKVKEFVYLKTSLVNGCDY